MAEDEGFEPSVGFPTHAFQACALGRYANPPVTRSVGSKPRVITENSQLKLAMLEIDTLVNSNWYI